MDQPPFRIETCNAAKREPGLTIFNVRPGGAADRRTPGGWLLGSADNLPLSAFRAEYYPARD